jgi:hypothetical protein
MLLLICTVHGRGKTYEDIPNMAKSNGKKTKEGVPPPPEGMERKSIDGVPVNVVVTTPPQYSTHDIMTTKKVATT